MSTRTILVILLVATAATLWGLRAGEARDANAIVTKTVAYKHDYVELEGFLAYDPNAKGKRPGVLVIHEWWGLGEHPKARAKKLAELGYVAFCADMYGKGKLTTDIPTAQKWSGAFYKDRAGHGRARIKAGYDVLAGHELVDPARIGAMGFCYGGTVALEVAWSGLPVKAVVSFHGSLTTPGEADLANVKSSILVCHGADDAFVPEDQVSAFVESMKKNDHDWVLVNYGNAVHSFTHKGAGERGINGVKYNAEADARSWAHMKAFFAECLAP